MSNVKLLIDHELAEAFGSSLEPFADLAVVRSTHDVEAADPTGVQAIVVRTDQKIRPAVAARFRQLEAVFTASAGRDHVGDVGVPVVDARGGNAAGVADWVVLALLRQVGFDGLRPRVGVLGCGETGGRVLTRLRALGFPTIAVDPPRQRRDPTFLSAPVEALQECDVLTLHVPLTPRGLPFATEGWLDAARLAAWRRPVHVLSAARGEVVDEAAVLEGLASGRVASFSADVFLHEPRPRERTIAATRLATPHVAGRSDDGRRGLQQRTLHALSRHFGWNPAYLPDLPPEVAAAPAFDDLLPWLDAQVGFGALDAALRADTDAFATLRSHHRRRDLAALRLEGGSEAVHRAAALIGLGAR